MGAASWDLGAPHGIWVLSDEEIARINDFFVGGKTQLLGLPEARNVIVDFKYDAFCM